MADKVKKTGSSSHAAPTRRRGGRPSVQDAEKLRELILDVATEAFLENGYGDTSIEMLAKRAGISKRTFYHRFNDKMELFGAVIHRLVARLRPAGSEHLFEGNDLEEILLRLAKVILKAALMPSTVALQRMMIAESSRFPELAVIANAEGSRHDAITRIGALLQNHKIKNPAFAAEQFLQMVTSAPLRRALGLGVPMNEVELDVWAIDTVKLFLNGCHA